MKKFFKVFKNVFLYSVVAFVLVHLVFSALLPEKMMQTLGYRNFVVLSPSMEPVIDTGDMIFIRNVDEADIQVGDIITFSVYISEFDSVNFVTHYVGDIYTNGDGEIVYETQGFGKASNDFDDWEDAYGNPVEITYEDIEGTYLFKIPKVGYVSAFLSNPVYLGIIIINISVIYFTVQYIKKQSKQESNELED